MKIQALVLIMTTLVVTQCTPSKEKQESSIEYFGEQITLQGKQPVRTVSRLMSEMDTAQLKLEGTIVQTCSKKGCWMTVDLGEGEMMRVTFKDYGFFVPKEGVAGKKVVFDGTAIKSVTSVEELQHYAEDAGSSQEEIAKITSAKEEYKFVASGVAIL